MTPRWVIPAAIAVAIFAAAAFGWWLGQPKPVQETAAPAQHQADGSLILPRQPDAAATPAQQVPRGAKVERVGRVTVQPRQPDTAPGEPHTLAPLPPVSVDWSLVREPDGGRRMLASSPDGAIIGGVDVPIESAAPPAAPKRWAAGLSWSPSSSTAGVWIERDVPVFSKVVRVGADVNQVRVDAYATGVEGRLRVGFAF